MFIANVYGLIYSNILVHVYHGSIYHSTVCISESFKVETLHLKGVIPGWSGGAMVLCKLPVPGRPACLD